MTLRARRSATVAAAIGIAGMIGAGGALADANNKNERNDYRSHGSSSAGLDLLGDVAGAPVLPGVVPPETAGIIVVGSTSTESNTNRGGSDGHASATPLSVLGLSVPGTASECAAAGDPDSGKVRSTDHASALSVGDGSVAQVSLLSSSCEATAVKTNNASGHAEASVASAAVPDVASVSVLTSESDSKTTSGQSHSDSSFTVVAADVEPLGDAGEVVIVRCSASSFDNNGTEGSSSSTTPVSGVDAPVACPLAESESTYTK